MLSNKKERLCTEVYFLSLTTVLVLMRVALPDRRGVMKK